MTLGLPAKFDFRFNDLVIDLDAETDGEGISSKLVPGVAGANSDRRGRGTFAGSGSSVHFLHTWRDHSLETPKNVVVVTTISRFSCHAV